MKHHKYVLDVHMDADAPDPIEEYRKAIFMASNAIKGAEHVTLFHLHTKRDKETAMLIETTTNDVMPAADLTKLRELEPDTNLYGINDGVDSVQLNGEGRPVSLVLFTRTRFILRLSDDVIEQLVRLQNPTRTL